MFCTIPYARVCGFRYAHISSHRQVFSFTQKQTSTGKDMTVKAPNFEIRVAILGYVRYVPVRTTGVIPIGVSFLNSTLS